jgi:predicted RNase H-like HicB family nuclease
MRYNTRVVEYAYTAIFEANEAGGYTVSVPALPGLVTEGRTIDEARAMAEDAIRCYLEGLLKDGEPIPEEPALLHEKIRVALPA